MKFSRYFLLLLLMASGIAFAEPTYNVALRLDGSNEKAKSVSAVIFADRPLVMTVGDEKESSEISILLSTKIPAVFAAKKADYFVTVSVTDAKQKHFESSVLVLRGEEAEVSLQDNKGDFSRMMITVHQGVERALSEAKCMGNTTNDPLDIDKSQAKSEYDCCAVRCATGNNVLRCCGGLCCSACGVACCVP